MCHGGVFERALVPDPRTHIRVQRSVCVRRLWPVQRARRERRALLSHHARKNSTLTNFAKTTGMSSVVNNNWGLNNRSSAFGK